MGAQLHRRNSRRGQSASGGTRAYNEMARMSIEKMTAFAEAQIAGAGAAMGNIAKRNNTLCRHPDFGSAKAKVEPRIVKPG
jgi:hypothetical protein